MKAWMILDRFFIRGVNMFRLLHHACSIYCVCVPNVCVLGRFLNVFPWGQDETRKKHDRVQCVRLAAKRRYAARLVSALCRVNRANRRRVSTDDRWYVRREKHGFNSPCDCWWRANQPWNIGEALPTERAMLNGRAWFSVFRFLLESWYRATIVLGNYCRVCE